MRERIELVPHDPQWPAMAAAEAQRIADALGDNLVDAQHIGSTAVAGLKAKPIVDLLPRVRSLPVLDAQADRMRELGYRWRGEFGIPGRRYCTRDDPSTGRRLFNVHVFQRDAAEIARHLAFRDYLRAHAPEVQAYELEKQRAAALHPNDVLAYNDAKSPWIKACELRALAWWERARKEHLGP